MSDIEQTLYKIMLGLSQIESGKGIQHSLAKKRISKMKSKWGKH